MKKDYNRLVSGLLAVGLIFSIFQIYSLKNEVESLRNRVDNNYTMLERDINSIYSNVDYQLKKQANLLNDYNWEYISADIPAGTAVVRCTVEPKEYTTATQAVIVVDGMETPMTFENGEYTALVTVSLYTDSIAEKVYFTDGNTVKNQELHWGISPRNEYLTTVYADFRNGGGKASHLDNGMEWNYSGTISITAERKGLPVDIQHIYLITEKDGREIIREELSVKEGMENYADSHRTREPRPAPDGENINIIDLVYEKEVDLTLEKGTEILLKTEVVDSDGLHHITAIEGWRLTASGENQTYMGYRGAEAELYSADGTPLFTYSDEAGYWW